MYIRNFLVLFYNFKSFNMTQTGRNMLLLLSKKWNSKGMTAWIESADKVINSNTVIDGSGE